jgi:hypothetical protein
VGNTVGRSKGASTAYYDVVQYSRITDSNVSGETSSHRRDQVPFSLRTARAYVSRGNLHRPLLRSMLDAPIARNNLVFARLSVAVPKGRIMIRL